MAVRDDCARLGPLRAVPEGVAHGERAATRRLDPAQKRTSVGVRTPMRFHAPLRGRIGDRFHLHRLCESHWAREYEHHQLAMSKHINISHRNFLYMSAA